jgi:hypothetical protein
LFSDRCAIVWCTDYGLRKWLGALAALSGVISKVDPGLDRLAGPEPSEIRCRLIEHDFNRYPLDYFNEIPGGIFRRQQGELPVVKESYARFEKIDRADSKVQRADVGPYPGPYPFSHGVSYIVQIGFEPPLPCSGKSLVDRKTYARALESKNFSKKSLSLIGLPYAKTADDSR